MNHYVQVQAALDSVTREARHNRSLLEQRLSAALGWTPARGEWAERTLAEQWGGVAIFEDEDHSTWIVYNTPTGLEFHEITVDDRVSEAVATASRALRKYPEDFDYAASEAIRVSGYAEHKEMTHRYRHNVDIITVLDTPGGPVALVWGTGAYVDAVDLNT